MNKQKLLQTIAKPLLGTGIGTRLPWAHQFYKKMYGQGRGTFVASIPLGLQLSVQAGDLGPGLYLQTQGSYEPYETKIFLENVKTKDVVFDIGAHVGYYTLLAGKKASQGKVVAFEADLANQQLLMQNIKLNKLNNVTLVAKAIADKKGKVTFYQSQSSSGDHSLLDSGKETKAVTVEATTLDLQAQEIGQIPNILKIDVEGAELTVLKGAEKLLKNKKLRTIFLELSSLTTIAQTINILTKAGFSLNIIDEKKTKQDKGENIEILVKQISKYGYINIVAMR